ncbi:helix-turn-helix transcriptional regulator [Rhodospirillaceae bacterium KN72]|uniref:Shikimate kinase n=1 Tax=Pacificispira spongiicola TaxID=2729598 RepID=A0A7Y0E360_9PROT|nr:helix-turn-helix transcriptional regulator [Pacificispira spongiicola]NMM46395.1 helix-turn-helix transcriptional regulator [Pacificispira spongiicola]
MSERQDNSDPDLDAYLAELGERVREARARRGMARRILARDSGVSERYLAQLESGTGNPTVAVLRQISTAVDYPLTELVSGEKSELASPELAPLIARLRSLPPELLPEARIALDRVGSNPCSPQGLATNKAGRIALIGLRGGGKSTLGRLLADRLHMPFMEINRLVEKDYGGSIGEILALSGQPAFRRLERRALETTIDKNKTAVIATGGGIVSESSTFQLLLDRCHTIWIKARPEEHMNRVLKQGDFRPMARNDEAMEDLKAILAARDPAYRQADAVLDTSGRSVEDSLDALESLARGLLR